MMNFGVESTAIAANSSTVKTVVARKEKTEAQLLDRATSQLLKAAKSAMLKKQGRVDAPPRSRLAGLREAMGEVPNPGGRKTNVARWYMEESDS